MESVHLTVIWENNSSSGILIIFTKVQSPKAKQQHAPMSITFHVRYENVLTLISDIFS